MTQEEIATQIVTTYVGGEGARQVSFWVGRQIERHGDLTPDSSAAKTGEWIGTVYTAVLEAVRKAHVKDSGVTV